MLSKSFIALIFVVSISSANAQVVIAPPLGVTGEVTDHDVRVPSHRHPCGKVNIAQTLDSSTAVPADASGQFSVNITNYNTGIDGSKKIEVVRVDPSATGNNFVAAKMVDNVIFSPLVFETKQSTAQLPPGTKCTGGASKNLCLASFTTVASYGNYVAVSQGAASGAASGALASRSPSGASNLARSTEPRAADNDQKAGKSKGEEKNKVNGKEKNGEKGTDEEKGDLKKHGDKKKHRNKKKHGDKKKHRNKKHRKHRKHRKHSNKKKDGDKKKVKEANKTAPNASGATDSGKRSWSSRQVGNFA